MESELCDHRLPDVVVSTPTGLVSATLGEVDKEVTTNEVQRHRKPMPRTLQCIWVLPQGSRWVKIGLPASATQPICQLRHTLGILG